MRRVELLLERAIEALMLVGINAWGLKWCFVFMGQSGDLSALWGLLSLSALGLLDLMAVQWIRKRWREQ